MFLFLISFHPPQKKTQASALSIGLTPKMVAFVFESLRKLEASAGERLCSTMTLKNAVEADATSVRTVRIGNKSQTFSQQIAAWKRKHPHAKEPDHYLVHFRVLGLGQRGTSKFIIAPAESKVLPANCKPPQESIAEICQSKLLLRLASGTCCYADGCKSWKGASKKKVSGKKLKWRNVKHNRGEFVKNLKRKPGPKGSSLAGTQNLDRQWDWLKNPIPRSLNTAKDCRQDFAKMFKYLYAAVWRKNNPGQLLQKLGKLCREA